jgi:hypothetical protein
VGLCTIVNVEVRNRCSCAVQASKLRPHRCTGYKKHYLDKLTSATMCPVLTLIAALCLTGYQRHSRERLPGATDDHPLRGGLRIGKEKEEHEYDG